MKHIQPIEEYKEYEKEFDAQEIEALGQIFEDLKMDFDVDKAEKIGAGSMGVALKYKDLPGKVIKIQKQKPNLGWEDTHQIHQLLAGKNEYLSKPEMEYVVDITGSWLVQVRPDGIHDLSHIHGKNWTAPKKVWWILIREELDSVWRDFTKEEHEVIDSVGPHWYDLRHGSRFSGLSDSKPAKNIQELKAYADGEDEEVGSTIFFDMVEDMDDLSEFEYTDKLPIVLVHAFRGMTEVWEKTGVDPQDIQHTNIMWDPKNKVYKLVEFTI